MKVLLSLSSLVALSLALPFPGDDGVGLRAPSPFVNCGCQCDPYTWADGYGNIQGNCKSADKTGGIWCYTSSSSCGDVKYSRHRVDSYNRKRAWSYEACSTPALGSYQCSGQGNGGSYSQGGNYNQGGGYNQGSSYNQGSNPGSSGSGGPPNTLIAILGTRDASVSPGAEKKPDDQSVDFEQ